MKCDDFFVPQELCVGLSATQFWESYFKDDAELGFDKFMAFRGEQNIVMENWYNHFHILAKLIDPYPILVLTNHIS